MVMVMSTSSSTAGSYTTTYFMDLAAADLNRDGFVDLVGGSNNAVMVFMNNGNGTLAAPVAHPVPGGYSYLAAADINGDGYPDLILSSYFTSVVLNNGDGTFGAASRHMASFDAKRVATADFDGDGLADYAVSNQYSDELDVYVNSCLP